MKHGEMEQLRSASRLTDLRQAGIDRALRQVNLSFARWQVLDAARNAQGKAGPASMARMLGHSRQAVQRIVNELAEAGLVAITPDAQDKRARLVGLRAEGWALLEAADGHISAYLADNKTTSQDVAPTPTLMEAVHALPVSGYAAGPAKGLAKGLTRQRRVRAFERVQQGILDQIRSGHLSTGSQLPPERELAKRMGYGRSAVREALRSLEMSGVLHIESGAKGGAFVRESGSDGIQDSIRAMLILDRLPLSDLLEVRASLLGQCASLGAIRGSEEDFRLLDANIDALEETVARFSDQTAAIGAATDFYRLAARASHNPLMVLLVDAMAGLVAEMLASLGRWPRLDAVTPRREMVAAMREGRADDAERVIRMHSRETNQLLIKFEKQLSVRAKL